MDNKLSMDKQFVTKLTEIIETNLSDEKFGVSELASELNISRSTLHRKVKTIVKKTVSAFIREIRLKRAYALLQQNTGTVSEVAYHVGFGSVSYFIKCFQKHFGFSPGEVLKGYHHIPDNMTLEEINIKKKSYFKKILALILFTLTILAVFFVPRYFNKTKQVKTIAILPFEYIYPEENRVSLINGLSEDLKNNINSLGGYKLIAPNSNNNGFKNDFQQAKDHLITDFILTGKAVSASQKFINLTFQLFKTDSSRQILLKSWNRRISWENYFEVLFEITVSIAENLNVKLTPKEEYHYKIPETNNITAFSLYTHARYSHKIFREDNNYDALKKAKILYQTSLDYDSTFVLPMNKLGWLYLDEFNFIDGDENINQAILLANKAIELKPDFSDAYVLKGVLLQIREKNKEATVAFQRAIKINPKEWRAYYHLAQTFALEGDMYNVIDICLKAQRNNIEQSNNLWQLSFLQGALTYSGFFEEAGLFRSEMTKIHNDTLRYLRQMQIAEICKGDYRKSIEYGLKITKLSEDLTTVELLAKCYLILREYKKAEEFFQQFAKLLKSEKRFPGTDSEISSRMEIYMFLLRIYFYQGNYGLNLESDIFNVLFNNKTKKAPDSTNIKALIFQEFRNKKARDIMEDYNIGLYELIISYSPFSSREITVECLNMLNERISNPIWILNFFNVDPFLDRLRDEPEYKEIFKAMERKYNRQHKRIQKLLSKNDIRIN